MPNSVYFGHHERSTEITHVTSNSYLQLYLLSAAERRGTPVREGFLYQESAFGRVL